MEPTAAFRWERNLKLAWLAALVVPQLALWLVSAQFHCGGGSSCSWYGIEFKDEIAWMGIEWFLTIPVAFVGLLLFLFRPRIASGAEREPALKPQVANALCAMTVSLGMLVAMQVLMLFPLLLGKWRVLTPEAALTIASQCFGLSFLSLFGLWLWGIVLVLVRSRLRSLAM